MDDTAAKLDDAIFWKIVITKPSGCPFDPADGREVVPVAQVVHQRVVEFLLGVGEVETLVWTWRRENSGSPLALQASACVRRKTTALSRCRLSTMSPVFSNSRGSRRRISIQKRKWSPWCGVADSSSRSRLCSRSASASLKFCVLWTFLPRLRCRQVVGLVEDDQIPLRRFQQPLHASGSFQRVDADDEPVVLRECVALAVGHVAFGAEHLEIQAEGVVQFSTPVIDQARRHHHHGAVQFAA